MVEKPETCNKFILALILYSTPVDQLHVYLMYMYRQNGTIESMSCMSDWQGSSDIKLNVMGSLVNVEFLWFCLFFNVSQM